MATVTGVQPKMSALLATLVRATPARNSELVEAGADQAEHDDPSPFGARQTAAPPAAGRRSRAPRTTAIAARKTADASSSRRALKETSGKSRRANLMTEKLLPQMTTIRRSRRSSMSTKNEELRTKNGTKNGERTERRTQNTARRRTTGEGRHHDTLTPTSRSRRPQRSSFRSWFVLGSVLRSSFSRSVLRSSFFVPSAALAPPNGLMKNRISVTSST